MLIRDGRVYLNGEELVEEYLDPSVVTPGDLELTVSEGCAFLLGDNRAVSIDCDAAEVIETLVDMRR